MVTLKELQDRAETLRAQMEEIFQVAEKENREFSEQEQTAFDAAHGERLQVLARIDRTEKMDAARAQAKPRPRQTQPDDRDGREELIERRMANAAATMEKPRRSGRLRHFAGPDAEKSAYRFGQWCLAIWGKQHSRDWCQANGIPIMRATQTEGDNTAGGYFVPEEFDSDIIDLREKYGVFRMKARRSVMTSDTKVRNRVSTGLTPYFVGETEAITKSTKKWNQTNLTAKKLGIIAIESNDLMEDAIMNIGDDIAGEIAYQFANKEDDCGFNGDGTSTYGKIVGVRDSLKNLSGTIANIAGLVVGAGNAYSELTIANFTSLVGLLPQFADTPNTAWFVHRVFYYTVMYDLMADAGGNTVQSLAAGAPPQFMGYPVIFTQVMPKTEANSQVCALLGDLALAADFGDRRQMTLSFAREGTVSSVNLFEQECFAIKGVERFDINVHDVGNAHATAASRVPGPIVGLITANA